MELLQLEHPVRTELTKQWSANQACLSYEMSRYINFK